MAREREHDKARNEVLVRSVGSAYTTLRTPVTDDRAQNPEVVNPSLSLVHDTPCGVAELDDAPETIVAHAVILARLDAAVADARRSGRSSFVLLILDVDGFTAVTASYGKAAADRLLLAVGERLRSCLRAGDSIARYGCDEFCILVRCTSENDVVAKASERISRQLAAPFVLEGHFIAVSVSAGIARVLPVHATAADVCGDAYAAVHHAKLAGGNQCALFDRTMHETTKARLQLDGELRHAFERDEYVLHYMPIVSTTTGRLVSLEALIRWEHPIRGCLPPSAFLEQLLTTGLMMDLGRWIVRTVCRQLTMWRQSVPRIDAHVSINVSPRQLVEPGFVDDVTRILEETGVSPNRIALEITEDLALDDSDVSIEVLAQLRARGICVRLDDFGTGYSSLSYLQRLPVHGIKIDRSFLEHFEINAHRREIVAAIIRLAHILGLDVVAEGVERQAQADALREMGCDLVQGFHVSPPIRGDELPDWISANHAG